MAFKAIPGAVFRRVITAGRNVLVMVQRELVKRTPFAALDALAKLVLVNKQSQKMVFILRQF